MGALRRPVRLSFVLLGLLALLAALVLPGAAAAKTVPGNNGTVKIHQGGLDGDQSGGSNDIDNDPHVCTFHLHFYFADAGQAGTWWIESWPPTGNGTVVLQGTYLTGANGEYRTPPSPGFYTLPDGHYKLFWEGRNDQNIKHKVFWVSCVAATPTPTATETETPKPTPTATETPKPTPTATETARPTPTATETETATPRPTPTATETETATPRPTPTATETETATPRPTPTATETETPKPTPTATETESAGPTATGTVSVTPTPTGGTTGGGGGPTPAATEVVGGITTGGGQATPPPTATDSNGTHSGDGALRVMLIGLALVSFAMAAMVPAVRSRRKR